MHVCQYFKLLSQKQINSLYKEHVAHLNFNFVQPKNKFLVLLGNTNSAYGINCVTYFAYGTKIPGTTEVS